MKILPSRISASILFRCLLLLACLACTAALHAAEAIGLQASLAADPMDSRMLVLTLSNTSTKPLALDAKQLPRPQFVPPSSKTVKPTLTPADPARLAPGQWKLLEPGKKMKVRVRLSDELSQGLTTLTPGSGLQVCLSYPNLIVGTGNPPQACPSPVITSNAVLYQLRNGRLDVTELP